jgi:hypothetical protein
MEMGLTRLRYLNGPGSRFASGPLFFSRCIVEAAREVGSRLATPKWPIDFERLAVPLKRYPDAKPEFFCRLFNPAS